ncbi:hypothetical protein NHX12_024639 [Muraenolepis orangiensis]|uniref:Uncharacterized protein n=1 Tax=Muraenolepis orangiensis TaxID=630683 RepID=A0A9Q0IRI2_9TELE|nr:hypothetical protein NHX12_024639 [Muraenolepis orangiensis]
MGMKNPTPPGTPGPRPVPQVPPGDGFTDSSPSSSPNTVARSKPRRRPAVWSEGPLVWKDEDEGLKVGYVSRQRALPGPHHVPSVASRGPSSTFVIFTLDLQHVYYSWRSTADNIS